MVWRNLSCHFLKVWGCATYVKKVQSDKREPKADKCILIGYPKQLDTSPISDPEAKCLFLETGPLLRRSFSRNNWVGGWWNLTRLVNRHFNQCVAGCRKLFLWRLHQLKWKLMMVIIELRIKLLVGRQGRVLVQNGTVTVSWRSCCWTTMNLRAMEKRWWARIPTNGWRPWNPREDPCMKTKCRLCKNYLMVVRLYIK